MIVDRSTDSKIATFKRACEKSRSRRRTLDLEIASSTARQCVAIPRLPDLAFGKRQYRCQRSEKSSFCSSRLGFCKPHGSQFDYGQRQVSRGWAGVSHCDEDIVETTSRRMRSSCCRPALESGFTSVEKRRMSVRRRMRGEGNRSTGGATMGVSRIVPKPKFSGGPRSGFPASC